MKRRFRIEWRHDGPIANAVWYLAVADVDMQGVEKHCRGHRIGWEKNLFRLIELVPLKVTFETIVSLNKVD